LTVYQVGIISAERDGLKRILESYDKEEAVIASHRKPGEAMASISLPSNFKDQHIKVQEIQDFSLVLVM
jgi:hypothetical protein